MPNPHTVGEEKLRGPRKRKLNLGNSIVKIPVHSIKHGRVSVHVKDTLKMVLVQVLQASEVEVKELVGVAQVLLRRLVEVVEAHKERSPLGVPVLLVFLKQGVVRQWGDQPDDPLVLCRAQDHLNLS